MKVPYTKNIQNLFQGLPNPEQQNYKQRLLKKDSQDFKNSFYLGLAQAWKAKWEGALFLVFMIVKKNSVNWDGGRGRTF